MKSKFLPPYISLNKKVGETPLACAEEYRKNHPELTGVPLAYAGRLDPMASGKLLVLVGDECKRQTEYHDLDKEYEFSILFGIESDTQDVLGRINPCSVKDSIDLEDIAKVANSLVGKIELPYPHFSSKTIKGKPLHTWTLEGRLNEIDIPTRQSTIYQMKCTHIETKSRPEITSEARIKIDTIPPVTDSRKALGNDFRRVDVRKDWKNVNENKFLPTQYQIAHFVCIASSGTYMRSLAALIGKRLNTCGLAWHIHRSKIGRYDSKEKSWVFLF